MKNSLSILSLFVFNRTMVQLLLPLSLPTTECVYSLCYRARGPNRSYGAGMSLELEHSQLLEFKPSALETFDLNAKVYKQNNFRLS